MTRRRVFISAGILVPAVAVLALLAYGFTREPRYIESPMLGRPAPAFELALFDGGRFRLDAARGKVVFVNFWASWCVPCREEMPSMERLYQKYRAKGLAMLAVNYRESRKEAQAFVEELKLTFPVLLDDGTVSTLYGVFGLPATYLVDRQGRGAARVMGARDWMSEESRAVIERLLKEKS